MKNQLLSFLATSLLLSSTTFADWGNWRGPTKDGISTAKNLPDTWSDTENIIWKYELPAAGSSTPAIIGDKIFLTVEADNGVQLLCISTAGKKLWQQQICETKKGGNKNGEKTNASPSPSADKDRVYVMTGTGEVAAYDHTGKKQWSFNAQEKYGKFRLGFGYHVTPVLHEGKLYLQLINTNYQIVVAIDGKSGKELWKVDRPSDGVAECFHSYASPTAINYESTNVIITHGHDYTIGHDPETGKELWRIGDLNAKDKYNRTLRFVASPVAHKNLVVAPSAKNRGVAGVDYTKAKGFIADGGKAETWRIYKGTPDVPSPIIYKDLVYLCRENGVGICLDAKTGEKYYEDRVYPQTYRANPVAANDRIFFTARDGTVSVIKAGKKLEILAKNKLSDQITASPAISNNRLYLRGYNTLYCIGKK